MLKTKSWLIFQQKIVCILLTAVRWQRSTFYLGIRLCSEINTFLIDFDKIFRGVNIYLSFLKSFSTETLKFFSWFCIFRFYFENNSMTSHVKLCRSQPRLYFYSFNRFFTQEIVCLNWISSNSNEWKFSSIKLFTLTPSFYAINALAHNFFMTFYEMNLFLLHYCSNCKRQMSLNANFH